MNEGKSYPNWLVLLAFGFSGGAALIYEVVWTKVLSLVLGSTVYALSTMLAAFMSGLALGAFLGAKKADRIKEPLLVFGVIEILTGIFGVLTLLAIGYIQPVYASLFLAFNLSFSSFSTIQFLLCFLIMMVPTTLMGMTFPVVCKALVKGMDEVGRDTGYVYAVNTAGAIVGSLSAGFLLIPNLGLKGANLTAASINFLASVIVIGCWRKWKKGVSSIIFIAAMGCLFLTSHFLYSFEFIYPINFYNANRFKGAGFNPWAFLSMGGGGMTLLFTRENAYGIVQVFKNAVNNDEFMMNNGKIEGGMGGDKNNQVLLALLPIAIFPDAKSFLNIGLGSGMTLYSTLESGVADVECVEINPSVIEAVREHFYPALFDNPGRPKFIIADARNYLSINQKRYDIISSEPSYPVDDSVSHLFTKEFFTLARSRLTENGVFCQWVPFYMIGSRGTSVMLKTFLEVFPNSRIWNVQPSETVKSTEILMIGSNSATPLPAYDVIKARLPFERLTGGRDVLTPTLKEGDEEAIMGNKRIPVNTDDLPIMEFVAVRNVIGN